MIIFSLFTLSFVSSADNNEKENAPDDTISLFCLLLAPISGESADVIQVAVKPQPPSFFPKLAALSMLIALSE